MSFQAAPGPRIGENPKPAVRGGLEAVDPPGLGERARRPPLPFPLPLSLAYEAEASRGSAATASGRAGVVFSARATGRSKTLWERTPPRIASARAATPDFHKERPPPFYGEGPMVELSGVEPLTS